MEVWVQRSFLDEREGDRSGSRAFVRRADRAEPRRAVRVDRSRVTRDPAVAHSHAQCAQAASDFRGGLARAFAGLSSEQQAALRAMLGRDPSRSAA
ncbi:MAG TPA: hypothetical protein VNL16_00575 [Chloroflexota bacterium]|nr:hypothetical protein [Chloroflexota bacterium]